jgi:hypothetical protein
MGDLNLFFPFILGEFHGNSDLLTCRLCHNLPLECADHPFYTWAKCFLCSDCGIIWYVCQYCSESKSKFERGKHLMQRMRRHHRGYHEDDAEILSIESQAVFDNKYDEEIPLAVDDSDADSSVLNAPEALTFPYESHETPESFLKAISGKKCEPILFTKYFVGHDKTQATKNVHYYEHDYYKAGDGPRSLVSLMLRHNRLLRPDDGLDSDVLWYGIANGFLSELSLRQRNQFVVLLNYSRSSPGLRIPENINQVNTMFLRGKYSMMENLPRPSIRQISADHVYIPI